MLPKYLIRLVSKNFRSDATGEVELFDGIVTEFDPRDVDQQFRVYYQDGDGEWLPASAIHGILTESPGHAHDLRQLETLHMMVTNTEAKE